MARFISIPVPNGDAFYLERAGFSVLVDGGSSRFALPRLFDVHVKRDGVDIAVCTHNDADHANGIIGFLEAGLRARQVWLPGRWRHLLNNVNKPSSVMIPDIIHGA